MTPNTATKPATAPRTPPTSPACSRTLLRKALTRARWQRRINSGRIEELEAELTRRQRRAAELDRAVTAAESELRAVDPDALTGLHDVSRGAR